VIVTFRWGKDLKKKNNMPVLLSIKQELTARQNILQPREASPMVVASRTKRLLLRQKEEVAMLRFCNSVREEVWVTYMFYSPDTCGGEGGGWQTIGWFPMAPGQCTTVYGNSLDDVNNRYWYYHAENGDGTIVWAGPIGVYVTKQAFNHCYGIGTTSSRIAGFRILDVGDYDDFTVTLTL
jgi:uncharacterized membrane protein